VLSAAQRRVLRQIGDFTQERGFYMGGGTAVALYLEHRRSEDFDWFTPETLDDPLGLAQALQESVRSKGATFETHGLEPGTLHGSIDGVNVSFLRYRYPQLRPPVEWAAIPCRAAALDDLACMKLVAVVQRGTRKDFVDVYALGIAHRPLRELLELYAQKYGIADPGHVLVGLSYFDDAERTPMPRMLWRDSWSRIRRTIQSWVKEVSG
jgi:hypothetical protein